MNQITLHAGVFWIIAVSLIGCDSNDAESDGAEISSKQLFSEVSGPVRLQFQHFAGATGDYRMPEIMGAGGALFDYDNDGDLDVYLLQGRLLAQDKTIVDSLVPIENFLPGNRLFRNELIPTGALRFVDVTDQANAAAGQGYSMGIAVGDIDNDMDLDFYLTNFGDNAMYRNNGDGTFTDITAQSGSNDPRWSSSAAFFDYDADGDLDLFVANYVDFKASASRHCSGATGERDYCGPQVFLSLSDTLFRNDGDSRFIDVSIETGIAARKGAGLGVTATDFNNDGWIDLYVANDQQANHLWINQGDGHFEETGLLSGSAYNMDGKAEASMGVTAGDVDGDGDDDLFMTHLESETNTLYLNDGAGNFMDETARFRLGGGSLSYTGFGSQWFDFDNDGDLDLFVANGAVKVEETLRSSDPYPYGQRNQLFINTGNDGFADISEQAGWALAAVEVSRGAAFGDIDNDGDIDILVTNNNGPARLLLNEVGNENHWLSIHLRGTASNSVGFGAKVALSRLDKPLLWRRVHNDGSYLSAHDSRVFFGLGSDAARVAITVWWPGGRQETWQNIVVDQFIELTEGSGTPIESEQ